MSDKAAQNLSVLFDNQITNRQQAAGIRRYFSQLVRLLPTVDPRIQVKISGKMALSESTGSHMSHPNTRARALFRRSVDAIGAQFHRNETAAVYHPTYTSRPHRQRTQSPLVVTVHDMIPELYPHYFRKNPHLAKRSYVKQASALFVVSQTTQTDLERLYDFELPPTFLTPLGVDHNVFKPNGDRAVFARPYVLFVGARKAYKDFFVAMRAMELSEHDDTLLVAVGGGPPTPAELAAVENGGLRNRVLFRSANDRQLAKYYRGAHALIFPSRYEGFGLPTLEAMASGTPAILSTAPALMEVSDGAAAHFEAGSPSHLALQLDAVLSDSQFRGRLRAQGLKRASEFSWERTAALTAEAYAAIAKGVEFR